MIYAHTKEIRVRKEMSTRRTRPICHRSTPRPFVGTRSARCSMISTIFCFILLAVSIFFV